MPVIEIKQDPGPRELRMFGALWLCFFGLVARLAFSPERSLLAAAGVTGACFLLSFILNHDYPRRSQLPGLAFPLAILAIVGWRRAGGALGMDAQILRWTLAAVLIAAGVGGGVATFASRSAGRRIYRLWMFAALPMGWTVSHILLGSVYFGVLTPVGLAMRILGKDPMQRKFDRAAATYWSARPQDTDPGRYFRQS